MKQNMNLHSECNTSPMTHIHTPVKMIILGYQQRAALSMSLYNHSGPENLKSPISDKLKEKKTIIN